MRSQLARIGAIAGLDGDAVTGPGDRITLATRVALGAAVLGLVASLVFGGLWLLAVFGPSARTVAVREDALLAARQLATNLQTLDYASVERDLNTWQDSATGPLLDEFTKNRAQYVQQMGQVRTTSTARVVDVALADLDQGAGTARALASVDVKTTQTPPGGSPSLPVNRQVRIQLDLVRVPDHGWKASAASAIRP